MVVRFQKGLQCESLLSYLFFAAVILFAKYINDKKDNYMRGQWIGSYSGSLDGKIMVNVDEEADLAVRCGVRALPAVLVFRSGVEVYRSHRANADVDVAGYVNGDS